MRDGPERSATAHPPREADDAIGRLLIVSRSALDRACLAAELQGLVDSDVETAAAAGEWPSTTSPDLVLLQDQGGGQGWLVDELATVAARWPAALAIVVAVENRATVRACLAAGARACLPPHVDLRVVGDCARLLRQGLAIYPTDTGPAPGDDIEAIGGDAVGDAASSVDLTDRQGEVVVLLAAGLGNSEIAARLGIRISTVKAHIRSVMRQMGVSTRIAVATRHVGMRGGRVKL